MVLIKLLRLSGLMTEDGVFSLTSTECAVQDRGMFPLCVTTFLPENLCVLMQAFLFPADSSTALFLQ